jgi:AraC-like DNA-binding protein
VLLGVYGIVDISTLNNRDNVIQLLSTKVAPKEYKVYRDELLSHIGVNQYKDLAYDDRVEAIIRLLNEYDFYDLQIAELAAKIGLSESRLAHLFKDETGIPLNGYFLMKKWRKAYEILLLSKNITKAAIDSGFCSSSHFSAANKKITGLPAQKILYNSEFLKVL